MTSKGDDKGGRATGAWGGRTAGRVDLLGKRMGVVSLAGEGEAGCAGDGGGGDDACPSPEREGAALAAEAAAEEEEAAAKAAASTRAAMVAAAEAKRTEASLQSPPPPSREQAFVTPRKQRSSRILDAFSSPPLAPLGSGRVVQEEGESEFLLDAGPPLPPEKGRVKSRDGLPPSGSGHARSGAGGGGALRTINAVDRPLSMGVAGVAMVGGEAGKREGLVAVAPPAFHDLVKRSTRFMTSGESKWVLLWGEGTSAGFWGEMFTCVSPDASGWYISTVPGSVLAPLWLHGEQMLALSRGGGGGANAFFQMQHLPS